MSAPVGPPLVHRRGSVHDPFVLDQPAAVVPVENEVPFGYRPGEYLITNGAPSVRALYVVLALFGGFLAVLLLARLFLL